VLTLTDKDSVTTSIPCGGGKALTCTSTFNLATGFLSPNAGNANPNCTNGIMGWTAKALELHPGKPDPSLCQ